MLGFLKSSSGSAADMEMGSSSSTKNSKKAWQGSNSSSSSLMNDGGDKENTKDSENKGFFA